MDRNKRSTKMQVMWRAIAVAFVAAVQLMLGACGEIASPNDIVDSANDPGEAFDSPPAWPGAQWSLDGKKVGWQVISAAAGPAHCEWQHATFLTLGWPPGTYSETSQHARQYIRDPKHVVGTPHLQSTLDLHAQLPDGTLATGLTYGRLSIYSGPDADRAIYVVGQHVTERWPRSDPMTLCA